LIPVANGDYYIEESDMRTYPFQEGRSDGGPSGRIHIEPLIRVMARRLEEEKGAQKTLLLWRIIFLLFFQFF